MKTCIACLVFIVFATACHKKQGSPTTILPLDSASASPYSKVETYTGQTIDSQWADGCGTLSKTINETFTVAYLKGTSAIDITGNTYIINNPCNAAADSGYKTYAYSRTIQADSQKKFVFLNDVTHIYETIEFRNDSFFINVQHWRCNTNDNCFFRGKRK